MALNFFVSSQYKYRESIENAVLRHVTLEGMKRIIRDVPHHWLDQELV